jgi:hypothetical protein
MQRPRRITVAAPQPEGRDLGARPRGASSESAEHKRLRRVSAVVSRGGIWLAVGRIEAGSGSKRG